jgi:putative aminopeptidase FrvX
MSVPSDHYSEYREILRKTLSCPTAPGREDWVLQWLAEFAADRGLNTRRDAHGNILLSLPALPSEGRLWILQAHTDHPGFVVEHTDGGTVQALFRGGIDHRFFTGSRVCFFTPSGDRKGTVEEASPAAAAHGISCRIRLDQEHAVPAAGCVGMWDLPACRIRGSRVVGRACDDLAGVAALLCLLDQLRKEQSNAPAAVLCTRGEEAGFIGSSLICADADTDSLLPPRSRLAGIINIECSKAQPNAMLGNGAVIRTGDRWQVFDAPLTALLSETAETLMRTGGSERYVRRLMPGGVCEASVWNLNGYPAGAVCLPLANYHNMGIHEQISAERIDLRDFASLVALLKTVVTGNLTPEEVQTDQRQRLAKRADELRRLL